MIQIEYIRLKPIWKYQLTAKAMCPIPERLRLSFSGNWNLASRVYDCYVDIRTPAGKQVALIYPDKIIALEGYCWDGPTGAVDTKTFMVGSLFHDILCQAMQTGLLPRKNQKRADKIMRHINKNQKMNPARRWWTYTAVRWYQTFKNRVNEEIR